MEDSLPFRDRSEAGHLLSEKLQAFAEKPNTIVLALVRGGVVVGRAIADDLKLPLHPYIVRKLGHPGHREFGLGATAEGGATFFDEPSMRMSGISKEQMQSVIEEEMAELERRKKAYVVRPRPPLAGTTVILTDDGAATGGTLFATIRDLRNAKARSIILALPVCPPDTALRLREKADEAVILGTPEHFNAVGNWYRHFGQVEDEEVMRLLKGNNHY